MTFPDFLFSAVIGALAAGIPATIFAFRQGRKEGEAQAYVEALVRARAEYHKTFAQQTRVLQTLIGRSEMTGKPATFQPMTWPDANKSVRAKMLR